MPLVTTPAGARIAWDDFGDPGHPPLVLIQGHGAQMVGWQPGFCERLAAEGFRVIRFDNRDVGQSQRYPEGGYTIGDMADDTAALLDGLGLDTAHIVGQSLGGIIAQQLAERHPARLRSLGLVYTAASVSFARGLDIIEDRLEVTAPTTREEFLVYYPASEVPCASTAYPQDVAWLTELAGVVWDRGWEPEGAERQFEALMRIAPILDGPPPIDVPVTILAGDADRLIDPAASVALHDALPDSALKIYPGMGHELPEALWDDIATRLGTNARLAETAVRS